MTTATQTMEIKLDNLITFQELIDKGLFKKGTLYYYTSQKLIPFIKYGKVILFDKAELEKWFAQQRIGGSIQYEKTPEKVNNHASVDFNDLLEDETPEQPTNKKKNVKVADILDNHYENII